jgi:hypothetical protein
LTALAAVVILGVYDYIYQYAPLPEYWNQVALDLLTASLAGAATVVGVFLIRQFDRGEAPRRVWLWFTMGWGAWFAGELIGAGYDLLAVATYPDFAIYDVCWIAGYFCFGLSLYYQYRLIYSGEKKFNPLFYFGLVAIILLATLGFTQLAIRAGLGEGKSWLAVYLAVLYPVCDVVEGLAAIWLSLLFGRGRWGRPWWSLIAFAVADSIGILRWLGGLDNFSQSTQDYFSLFADTAYNIGYVIVLLAFLSLYFLANNPPSAAAPLENSADALPTN